MDKETTVVDHMVQRQASMVNRLILVMALVLELHMSTLHPQQLEDLVHLPSMAAIVLWVEAWETTDVLDRLNRLKPPRDWVVAPLADHMTHLAVEPHTKDRTSNTSTPIKAISPV
jgi:hypothetical protein